MKVIIGIVVAVVAIFAFLGYVSAGPNEREEGAKVGAVGGLIWLSNFLPAIILIVVIVLIVKACS